MYQDLLESCKNLFNKIKKLEEAESLLNSSYYRESDKNSIRIANKQIEKDSLKQAKIFKAKLDKFIEEIEGNQE